MLVIIAALIVTTLLLSTLTLMSDKSLGARAECRQGKDWGKKKMSRFQGEGTSRYKFAHILNVICHPKIMSRYLLADINHSMDENQCRGHDIKSNTYYN